MTVDKRKERDAIDYITALKAYRKVLGEHALKRGHHRAYYTRLTEKMIREGLTSL